MARTRATSKRCASSTVGPRPGSGRRIESSLAVFLALFVSGCDFSAMVSQVYGDRYEKCSSPTAIVGFERAQKFLAMGRVVEAVPLLRRCVEVCPGNVLYHIGYQDAAHSLPERRVGGTDVDAVAKQEMRAYYAAYADDGRSPLAPYFQARLQRLDNRHATSADLLDQALERDARFYFAHYERGLIWREVGNTESATGHFRAALALRSSFVAARRELAECYAELWEWTRAEEHYRLYLDLEPGDPVARRAYLTLIVYRVANRLDEAAAMAEELLRANPNDLSLQMDRAAVHWRRGETAAAMEGFRTVLRQDNRNAIAALNLGNLQYEIGLAAKGEARQVSLRKARYAYLFFQALDKTSDAYDWFDLNLGVPARLRKIESEIGAVRNRKVTLDDLCH